MEKTWAVIGGFKNDSRKLNLLNLVMMLVTAHKKTPPEHVNESENVILIDRFFHLVLTKTKCGHVRDNNMCGCVSDGMNRGRQRPEQRRAGMQKVRHEDEILWKYRKSVQRHINRIVILREGWRRTPLEEIICL